MATRACTYVFEAAVPSASADQDFRLSLMVLDLFYGFIIFDLIVARSALLRTTELLRRQLSRGQDKARCGEWFSTCSRHHWYAPTKSQDRVADYASRRWYRPSATVVRLGICAMASICLRQMSKVRQRKTNKKWCIG